MYIITESKVDIVKELEGLQRRLFDLSARNPFINVREKQLYFFGNQEKSKLIKLYQKSNFYKKEYDLEVSLSVDVFLKWKEPQRDHYFVSPLIFQPCKIKRKRKIEEEYFIQTDEDTSLRINPILKHSFKRFFDVDFPEFIDDVDAFYEDFIKQLSTAEHKLKVVSKFNEVEEWQLITKKAVGNFNYKKSLLGEDYTNIIKHTSKSVLKILDGDYIQSELPKTVINQVIPLDLSQKEAIRYADDNDIVIQGPPGTGKSHTIVGLIGHYLSQGKKVLFVSQKRTALEVVYDRLKKIGLDHLSAFLNTDKDEKKSFYKSLKKTWEEQHQPLNGLQSVSKKNFDLVDFYLGNYQENNEKLGQSIHETVKLLNELGFQKEELTVNGKVPSLKDWMSAQNFLHSLEKIAQQKLNANNLNDAFFVELNKAVFSEIEPLIKLEKRLDELSETTAKIDKIQDEYKLDLALKPFTTLSLAASVLAMVDKNQLDLLNPDSKKFRSFSNTSKKYHKLKIKVDRAKKGSSNWKNKPTKTEIIELIDLLKHREAPRGIFGFLRRNNERLKNAFMSFDSQLSEDAKIQLLEELRSEYHLESQLDEVIVKLKHHFKLKDPEKEIDQILYLRNKLDAVSQTDYVMLLEHENSISLINDLANIHPKIQSFNHLSKFIFETPPKGKTNQVLKRLDVLKSQLLLLKEMQAELSEFFGLNQDILNFIRNNNGSINKLTAVVAYHNLLEQTRFEPVFQKLSGKHLQKQTEEKIRYNQQIDKFNVSSIRNKYHKSVLEKEHLLATPASKLSKEEKNRKKELRAAKKLIIHEMNKVQRHMPVKEFIEKTWPFLQDLQAIWMMNPLSVSERLPCISAEFDVVVFDESSQIPLEDSVPSIYRAKQIVVVGDEHQMPPGRFFSASTAGNTLLDQAQLAFKKVMLKYHYRSQHPALIQFSNDYFYDNELIIPPPAIIKSPIEVIHLKEGMFENSKNIIEAKEIAAQLSGINRNRFNEVGIIAFSKEQELVIRKELDKKGVLNDELLIRNLENVQGIEKDEIWISVGYAKDKEGVFRLNFGPINQENGRNRLNVLFTRAKKRIRLFCSVKPEDFGISENQGVSCLKDYLNYALKISGSEEREINCDKAVLLDPCISTGVSKDLLTQMVVLNDRFKSVQIVLTGDLWNGQVKEDKIKEKVIN